MKKNNQPPSVTFGAHMTTNMHNFKAHGKRALMGATYNKFKSVPSCTFNEHGKCEVLKEFPELENKPCTFNKDGLCIAKPRDLEKICPECDVTHKRGKCDENEDWTIWVPKK